MSVNILLFFNLLGHFVIMYSSYKCSKLFINSGGFWQLAKEVACQRYKIYANLPIMDKLLIKIINAV